MNKYETLVSNITSFSVGMIIGASIFNRDADRGPAPVNQRPAKPPIEEKKKERKKIGFRLGNDER